MFLKMSVAFRTDLESGSIEFYDSNDANVGSLKFCVQQGLVEEPLMGLPTTDEFAVFSRADTCQEVDGKFLLNNTVISWSRGGRA